MSVNRRVIRAYAATRAYRKRVLQEPVVYTPPPDSWGKFSEEFSEEFDS